MTGMNIRAGAAGLMLVLVVATGTACGSGDEAGAGAGPTAPSASPSVTEDPPTLGEPTGGGNPAPAPEPSCGSKKTGRSRQLGCRGDGRREGSRRYKGGD